MAHGRSGTLESTSAGTAGRSRRHVRMVRSAALVAGVGLVATGCADYSGSLLSATGTNTSFCVARSEAQSVASALPLHVAQDEKPVTISSISPLNAEDAELGQMLLVPTTTEGVAGYGQLGASLVEDGHGDWDAKQNAKGATIDPGQNASLVIETRPTGEGDATMEGYRVTYTQDGQEHTVTVRQSVDLVVDGTCPPSEGGGDGRAASASSPAASTSSASDAGGDTSADRNGSGTPRASSGTQTRTPSSGNPSRSTAPDTDDDTNDG